MEQVVTWGYMYCCKIFSCWRDYNMSSSLDKSESRYWQPASTFWVWTLHKFVTITNHINTQSSTQLYIAPFQAYIMVNKELDVWEYHT